MPKDDLTQITLANDGLENLTTVYLEAPLRLLGMVSQKDQSIPGHDQANYLYMSTM